MSLTHRSVIESHTHQSTWKYWNALSCLLTRIVCGHSIKGYVDAALRLADMQANGKIQHIGVTNFDVPRLAEMLDAGVPIVSNQVLPPLKS